MTSACGAVTQLEDEGVMKAVDRRAAGPGVLLILEGASVDAIRARIDNLPFVSQGLLEYEEIYEI
jgi:hypothetical protein